MMLIMRILKMNNIFGDIFEIQNDSDDDDAAYYSISDSGSLDECNSANDNDIDEIDYEQLE